MRNYLSVFLISIVIHCILILILLTFKTNNPRNPIHIKLTLSSEKPEKIAPESTSKSSNNYTVTKSKKNPSLKDIPMDEILNYESIEGKISSSKIDSSHYQPQIIDDPSTDKIISFKHYLKDKLKEQYPDQFDKKSKQPTQTKIPLHADYICNKIEAKAFSFLFEKNKATQIDMYTKYDFSDAVTASEFDARLEKLVKMGFLSRKKISPQLIFTITALFIQIPVEINKKNRINPVYEYQPLIKKENLTTYLQAKLFQLKQQLQQSTTDTLQIKKKIASLQESLFILPGISILL